MKTCPDCNQPIDLQAIFCDNCGLQLSPETPPTPASDAPGRCSACGYKNTPGETFCQNCGVQLAPVQSSPPPPAKQYQPSELHPSPQLIQHGDATTGRDTSPVTCHECGYVNEAGHTYCQNCGSLLAPKTGKRPSDQVYLQPSGRQQISIDPSSAAPSHPLTSKGPCPSCGFVNVPGEHFCQNCGLPLLKPASEAELKQYETVPLQSSNGSADLSSSQPKLHEITGKLIHPESNSTITLPQKETELILGRVDPFQGIFPDIDLTPYGGERGGVSRQHARLSIQKGKVLLEDLNSINYTFVNKVRLLPGETRQLQHNDVIRLGGLELIYLSDLS